MKHSQKHFLLSIMIEEELNKIKNDLDRVDLMLAKTAEGIESIEMSIKFLQVELDHDLWGGSSAG